MELITTEVPENHVELVTKDTEIDLMFEELLLDTNISREVKLTPRFRMTLKTLNTQDVLNADTLYIATVSGVPRDVVDRVRMVSTLLYSITAVNGKNLYGDDEVKNRAARENLNKKLMSIPPAGIDILRAEYSSMIDAQTKLFEKVEEKIENF